MESLTTIATPHKGLYFIDLSNQDPGFYSTTYIEKAMANLGYSWDSLEEVRYSKMYDFDAEVPDHPNVDYFSIGT